MQKPKRSNAAVLTLLTVSILGGSLTGCDLFGGGLSALPFARITAVQLFDEPNYTVAFSVEGAVTDPSLVFKINWVFGDGGGFVEGPEGRISVTHRYAATGTYEVTAFVFDANDYVAQINGTVTVVPNGDGGNGEEDGALPGGISGPNPEDGSVDVSVHVTLTWTGSENATSYNVYLGTVEANVEAANEGVAGIFRGNITETEFDPEGLEPDTRYFWRVDEVNRAGSTTGTVLSFTTAVAPQQAEGFLPVDGLTTAPVAQVLQWIAGEGATSHDVYFGKSEAAVADATTDAEGVFQGNQTSATFDPEDAGAAIDGQLLPSTVYYWRIDEVGLGGTAKGEVLQFSTTAAPPQITGPIPADDSTDVDVNQNMSWSAAPSVESFDVYFGTDEVGVGAATRTGSEFKGNQASKIFDPDGLLGATDYYWRIDSLGPGGTTRGEVFKFTTAAPPPQVIDPFVPTNNETNVSVDIVLEWNAGAGTGTTDSFDVYLSTDEDSVANGSASASQGNQDAAQTTFDAGPIVTPDEDYFWRIDSVGPGGTTTGPLLRFHTGALPLPAEFPVPADGARGIALDVDLQWTAGIGAASHDVYFGTEREAVQNAGHFDAEFKGNQAGTAFDPGPLEGNREYFWRIDETSVGGPTKGSVWSFTTAPGPAINPTPLHEETAVALDIELSWEAGSGAVSHDVYYGTVEADVQNATTATAGIFKGNQTTTTFMPPDDLEGATTYYWRIDEVGEPADGTTKGEVWQFTTSAGQAAEPVVPVDGETGVNLDPTLMWNAGAGADSHDVYLGTSEADVEDATRASPEYQTNLPIGTETFTPAGPLDGNTMYFWRIDEFDPDDNVTKGAVWQFRTTTGQASDPVPADEETSVDLDADLSWTAGSGASSHDVYLGTVEADVLNATPATPGIFKGNQTETTFDPDSLDGSTTYYWRIDGLSTGGTSTGEVWEFTTRAGPAAKPIDPADGATDIELDPTLMWHAGDGADSHDVYFGTSEAAVEGATRASPEYQGNLPIGTETFTPAGPLDGCTTYYWRIDELDADDNVTSGDVWQFRTATATATDPIPEDLEVGVDINANLSWTAVTGTMSYDVYLSDVEADVISGAAFEGNQIGTTFDPDTLNGGTTYYWRIDPAGPCGTAVGSIWSFTTGAGQASVIYPTDGQSGVGLLPLLVWTPGTGTDTQDFYFGNSEAAVTTATRTSGEFQGNFAGGLAAIIVGPLNGLTFYYWRIDSVTADGTTIGEVWQFRTGPGKATNPTPSDFATDVSIEILLQWIAGIGAAFHDVYFSANLADIGQPAGFQGRQSGTLFDPGTLAADTPYYWRIDEVTAYGVTITEGDVWTFSTLPPPDQVGSPTPANGATDQSTSLTLSWGAPDGATSYDIYFSTTEADVTGGAPAAFQGNQVGRSYNPGTLANSTTYYWRIDAVNEAGTTAGVVWRFTTQP